MITHSGKDLGASNTSHTHSASDVTSGTFGVSQIPTISTSKISDFPEYIPFYANLTKSDKDSNGIFKTCTWELPSSKVVSGQPAKWVSQLSGGSSPKYTYRYLYVYNSDKSTVKEIFTFYRYYDEDNDLTQEVLQ